MTRCLNGIGMDGKPQWKAIETKINIPGVSIEISKVTLLLVQTEVIES